MADLSHLSDDELQRIANAQSLSHLSDADLEKLANSSMRPNALIDAVRSLPGGFIKGAAGIAGIPGDVKDLVNSAGDYISNKITGGNFHTPADPFSSAALEDYAGRLTGGYYEPKTTTGKIAERAAEFAPSLIGGEASVADRMLGRVLAPAVGSVAGENLGDENHPVLRAVGQTGGALLGAGTYGVGRALGQGFTAAKLTPQEVAQNYALNVAKNANVAPAALLPSAKGQTAAEALGPVGVANLAALGRRGGTTAADLYDYLKQRAAQAPGRILSDYEAASGIAPEEAQGNMQGIIERGQAKAAPLYRAAYAETPATSEHLERLAAQPDVRQGMALAIKNAQRRAIGKNETFDPNAYAVTGFNDAGDPIIGPVPTWQAYDMGKRGLDEMLEAYRNPITRQIRKTDTSDAIDTLRRGLIGALDKTNPSYKAARASAADYLSANEAFSQGGSHILSTSVPAAKAKTYFESLNQPNQEAYKAGIANTLFNQAQNNRLKPSAVLTPAAQAKLQTVLGEQKGQEFIDNLKQELALAQSGQRMIPGSGSITSDILNATKEQDLADTVRGASHFARALGDVASNRYGSAVANTLRGAYHFAPDLFRTGGMNEEARNAAGRLLMLPPEEFGRQLQALPPPRPSFTAAALAPYLLRKP